MKRAALIAIPLLFVLATIGMLQVQHRSRPGFPAPDFTLPGLDGKLYTLSALRGHVVMVNLWATWCPPCRDEMPSMETLYRKLKDRGFVVLAVAEDADGERTVGPFVEQLGLTFPVLLDTTGNVPHRYGITGYPETFIIDRQGNVVKHHVGPARWDEPAIVDYLLSLLAGPTPPS